MAEAANQEVTEAEARFYLTEEAFDTELRTNKDKDVKVQFARATVSGMGDAKVSMHDTLEKAQAADHEPKSGKNIFFPM